jgi:hypothetical protein
VKLLTQEEANTMSRAEAEIVAAALLREIAKESFSRHRNVATATREACQLVELAIKLEAFAQVPA